MTSWMTLLATALGRQGGGLITSAELSPAVHGFIERLPPQLAFLRDGLGGVAYWQLLGLLVMASVGLVLRRIVIFVVTSQGVRMLERMGFRAGGELVRGAARPVGTLLFAIALYALLPALRLPPGLYDVLAVALRVLAALAGVMVVYRVVDVVADVFERRASETESKLDDQLVPLVRKSVKVFVAAMGVIFVLQNMNVDVASLLAGASLGGLAFTLAAKDTVANLFGSLSIFADRPFQIGDWVVVAGGAEGVVAEVGMRTTRIRTFYDSLVTVPNAKIADSVVDNYGARSYRRVSTTLGLQYDTTPEQMQAFCEGVRAILQANPAVLKSRYEVVMSGFGAHSLDVMLYFFLEVPTWSEELVQRHNVFLEILRLAKALSVEFAFPTQTLHVASFATPTQPAEVGVPSDSALCESIEAFGPGGRLARPHGPKLTHGYLPGAGQGGGDEG
jgi:MscS family membrane protein